MKQQNIFSGYQYILQLEPAHNQSQSLLCVRGLQDLISQALPFLSYCTHFKMRLIKHRWFSVSTCKGVLLLWWRWTRLHRSPSVPFHKKESDKMISLSSHLFCRILAISILFRPTCNFPALDLFAVSLAPGAELEMVSKKMILIFDSVVKPTTSKKC